MPEDADEKRALQSNMKTCNRLNEEEKKSSWCTHANGQREKGGIGGEQNDRTPNQIRNHDNDCR